MATSRINIDINAQDNASATVENVSNNISTLNTRIINISQSLQALSLGWDMIGSKILEFAKSGIEANTQLESLQNKLTGLISANSANVTSTGEIISAQQKWQISSQMAQQAKINPNKPWG